MHDDDVDAAVPPEGDIDEAQLFETLCELEPEAQAQRLRALDRTQPALAARLRRLLAIDEAYGTHTARSVVTPDMSDPVGDISDIGAFRLVRQIGRGGMGVCIWPNAAAISRSRWRSRSCRASRSTT